MLEGHPLIETLYYPGLPSHPDHELAKRVFTSGGPNSNAAKQTFGGMLAFIVAGDPDTALRRAQRFAERLELVTLAVSLGGEPPHPATHRTRKCRSVRWSGPSESTKLRACGRGSPELLARISTHTSRELSNCENQNFFEQKLLKVL